MRIELTNVAAKWEVAVVPDRDGPPMSTAGIAFLLIEIATNMLKGIVREDRAAVGPKIALAPPNFTDAKLGQPFRDGRLDQAEQTLRRLPPPKPQGPQA